VEFYTVENINDEQKQIVKQFRLEMEGLGYGDVSDGTLLRFLVSRQFDIPLSRDKLKMERQWRIETNPAQYAQMEEDEAMKNMANSRLVVLLPERDRHGRPVLFVQASRMDKNWDWDTKVRSTYKLIEGVCQLVPDDGNFVIIWDMQTLGWNNVDYSILKFAIDLLQNYYPERMGFSYVINTNWIFRIAWGIVAPWLDPRTRSKVIIVGDDMKPFFVQYLMNEEVLPTRFGGQKDDEELFINLNAIPEPQKGWFW